MRIDQNVRHFVASRVLRVPVVRRLFRRRLVRTHTDLFVERQVGPADLQ